MLFQVRALEPGRLAARACVEVAGREYAQHATHHCIDVYEQVAEAIRDGIEEGRAKKLQPPQPTPPRQNWRPDAVFYLVRTSVLPAFRGLFAVLCRCGLWD